MTILTNAEEKPKVTDYKNPRWSSSASITCDIMHPFLNEWVPFTCIELDPDSLIDSKDLWDRLINDQSIIPWVAPTEEELLVIERRSMICTKTQFIIALGKSRYTTLITELNKDENWETQISFETTQTIFRTQQFVDRIRIMLNMTEEEIDTLFRQASQIVV